MKPERCCTQNTPGPSHEFLLLPNVGRAAAGVGAGMAVSATRLMLSFVTFKWRPAPGYRSNYGPEQVNTLRRMVARHYDAPHIFYCVTDNPSGLDPEVISVPLWDDYANLPNPSFRGGPSCFRRLKLFSSDIGALLGDRIVHMDLDVVITGDLRPLLDRSEPFVGWRNPNPRWPLNGSFFMLRAGAHSEVWEDFDADLSPAIANAAGCRGSDQGWMSYVLGRDQPTWSADDGVYSFQDELYRRGRFGRGRSSGTGRLPDGARVVVFHGALDPWMPEAVKVAPWIKEHYR